MNYQSDFERGHIAGWAEMKYKVIKKINKLDKKKFTKDEIIEIIQKVREDDKE